MQSKSIFDIVNALNDDIEKVKAISEILLAMSTSEETILQNSIWFLGESLDEISSKFTGLSQELWMLNEEIKKPLEELPELPFVTVEPKKDEPSGKEKVVKLTEKLKEEVKQEEEKKKAEKKPKKIDQDKIVSLWKAGWPAAKIADEIGCSEATIYNHAAKLGLPKRR